MSVKNALQTSLLNFAKASLDVFALKEDIEHYSVAKQATAEEGYIATYQLTKDGVGVGEKINIPKDYLVKDADVKTVTTADEPVAGYKVGQKYMDFMVNTVGDDGTVTHMYLLADDVVTPYSAGNGIELGAGNIFSIKIDTTNANGLAATQDGLKMGLASSSSNGALSAVDWNTFNNKLDEIAVAASTGEGNVITGIELDQDGHTVKSTKGITALTESDFVALTLAECQTIYTEAKAAAASSGD